MLKLALLTTTALILAAPVYATGGHTPAPAPTPAPPATTPAPAVAPAAPMTVAPVAASSPTVNNNNQPSQRQGQGQSQGQTSSVNNTNNISAGNGSGYGGPGTFPASTAYAPSFALSSICQEAISGGVSVFWAGASGGKVYTLQFCKTKMKADYFRSLGRDDMAKAAECKDGDFRALYKETATPCREDMSKTELAQPIAQQQQVLNAGGLRCVDAGGRPVALGQPGAVRCQ